MSNIWKKQFQIKQNIFMYTLNIFMCHFKNRMEQQNLLYQFLVYITIKP